MDTTAKPATPKKKKKKFGKILAFFLVLALLWHYLPQLGLTNFFGAQEPKAKDIPTKDLISHAETISEHLTIKEELPERSLLREGKLNADSNMQSLLQSLATDLQSSYAFGLINGIADEKTKAAKTAETLGKAQGDYQIQLAQLETTYRSGEIPVDQYQSSKTELLQKIDEEKKQISDLKTSSAQKITTAKGDLKMAFKSLGFSLENRDIDAIVDARDSKDIVGLCKAFNSLKVISLQLEAATRGNPSKEQCRKYYGSYTVTLLAFDHIQHQYLQRIQDHYIPELNKLAEEATSTQNEAVDLLTRAENLENPTSDSTLRQNIKTAAQTLRQIQKEKERLLSQKSKLEAANKKLAFAIATAKNTYVTLDIQKEVDLLIQENSKEIETILSLSLPDMISVDYDTQKVYPPLLPPKG
jgi:hypothetical protein